jgi:8-oxo-dGTP pyrophosphatase MutT (NUDIX family)
MDTRQPSFYAAAYLVLLKGDEVLLLHRAHTGWMDNHWGFPAGHIEGAESVRSAALREAKEEVGVDLTESEFTLRHVMHRHSSDRVYFDFFFTADGEGREIRNAEPDKHDELKWFKMDKLPENTIPYLKRVLERIKRGEFFSEDVTV